MHSKNKSTYINFTFSEVKKSLPFTYKKTVFVAVTAAKLLYGCESWFNKKAKAIAKQYICATKSLFGVCKQIFNGVVLTALGAQDLHLRF